MEIDWTSDNAKFLRNFLSSDTGKKLTEAFKASEPSLAGNTLEERAMAASAFEQWQIDKEFVKSHIEIDETPATRSSYIDVEKLNVAE